MENPKSFQNLYCQKVLIHYLIEFLSLVITALGYPGNTGNLYTPVSNSLFTRISSTLQPTYNSNGLGQLGTPAQPGAIGGMFQQKKSDHIAGKIVISEIELNIRFPL